MNEDSVNTMAKTLLNQPTLSDIEYYAVVILLVLILGSLIAFFKTLYSEKAKFSAMKASLDAIREQTELTASVSETIKNDLEYQSWDRKEKLQIRRVKLEEYFLLVGALNNNLNNEMLVKLFDHQVTYDPQCYDRANMIQSLYFPELDEVHKELTNAVLNYQEWVSDGLFQKAKLASQGVDTPMPTKEFMAKQPELLAELVNPTQKTLSKVKSLAAKLNT